MNRAAKMEKDILAGLFTETELRAFIANLIAIAIGFLLKVAQDWKNDRASVKSILIQAISSFGIGYFVWKASYQFDFIARNIEIILGLASLTSSQIVVSAEALSKEGIKGFVRKKIKELSGGEK